MINNELLIKVNKKEIKERKEEMMIIEDFIEDSKSDVEYLILEKRDFLYSANKEGFLSLIMKQKFIKHDIHIINSKMYINLQQYNINTLKLLIEKLQTENEKYSKNEKMTKTEEKEYLKRNNQLIKNYIEEDDRLQKDLNKLNSKKKNLKKQFKKIASETEYEPKKVCEKDKGKVLKFTNKSIKI